MKRSLRFCLVALSFSAFAGCGNCMPEPETPPSEAVDPTANVEPAPAPAVAEAPVPAPEPARPLLKLSVVTASPEGFLVNSALVTGEKDAILIDAQFTLADGKKVADAVRASQKNLTQVYVTHFHPDHYFGFVALKEAFPNAKLVALPSTVEEVKKSWADKVKQWKPMYKTAIPDKPVVPEPLAGNTLEIEGQKLEIIGGVQGDSENNSFVWIPELRAAICGDIVYDGVFPWTAETTKETRAAWTATLDKLIGMNPAVVVPGHQKPESQQTPASLTFTKDYLAAFDDALASSKNAAELQTKLKAKYPDAALDVILKIGAEAAFKKPAAPAKPAAAKPASAPVPAPAKP